MKSLLIIATIVLASCTSTAPTALDTFNSSSLNFPAEFKATHHLTLKIKDHEYELTGYLIFKSPNNYYAAAYTEAGKAIFRFKMIDGIITTLNKPTILSIDAISEGIGVDLAAIFSNKISENKEIYLTNLIPRNDVSHPKVCSYYSKKFHYSLTIELIDFSESIPEDFKSTLKAM